MDPIGARASRSSRSLLPAAPVEGVSRTTLVVVACGLVVAALVAVRTLVAPVLLGACVAAIVRPWTERLRRFGPRRVAAAITAAFVLAFAVPLSALSVAVLSEARSLIAIVRAGKLTQVAASLFETGELAASPRDLVHAIGLRIADAVPSLLSSAGELALEAFVFLMSLYYALADGDRAMAFARRVSPLARQHLDALVAEFVEVGRAVLLSLALTAIVEGGAAGIAYVAVGLPGAALLTVATAIAALVPIGTIVVWGPVAALLWAEGRVFAAGVVVFTGVVVIGGIDHLVRPQLARLSRARLHPLLVFLGMFGGLASLGGWGLFAGPLVVALGVAALRLWDREQCARARASAVADTVVPVSEEVAER